MDRDNFASMFRGLIKTYGSKNAFDIDDYYNQVKYLPDHILNKLRSRIIEACEYLPKPAELKKISKEFATPFVKKEHPEINYDNCLCGEPVYKANVDAWLCKKHFEDRVESLESINSPALKWYLDGPLPISDIESNAPLLKTIQSIRTNYGF